MHLREYVEEGLVALDALDAVLVVVLVVVLRHPGDGGGLPLGQVVNAARLGGAVALEGALALGQRGVGRHQVAVLSLAGAVQLDRLLRK